ncbi:hypothetical protein EJB05_06090, partial [Eragrostis curvula]
MKPPPRLPLVLRRRRHLSSSISDSAAAELAGALAAEPSPDSTRDLSDLLRRLGARGLASALLSLPAPVPAASALRLLQHVLSSDARRGDDILSPRVSALLLASLVADRDALPSARRLISRLLRAHPLPVAAAAVADAASAAASDLLVRACLNSPGPGSLCRAADAFHVLCSRGASPSIVTCNILVEALVRAGQLDAASKVFDRMRVGKSVAPDGYTYTSMIKAFCRTGDVDAAFEMLVELQGAGLQPTVVTYNVLMDALCKSGRVEEAFRLKGRMVEGGLKPSVFTFGILINGLARNERFVEVGAVLQEMEGYRITPNEVIYNELIGWHCRKGHCSEALKLFGEMVSQGMKPTAVTYNLIAKALCKDGEMERAEQILDEMLSAGMAVHCGLFNTLIAWLLQRTSRLDTVVRLTREMIARGMKPNDPLLTACTRELCKGGKHHEAAGIWFELLAKGLGVNIATSNALIHGLCEGSNMKEATKVLRAMVNRGVALDSITYNIMIQGCCKDNKMEEAIQLHGDMIRRGLKPDLFTFNTFLRAYCNLGKMDEVHHLLDQMKNEGLKPDIVTYGTIIDGYCKAKNIQKANEYMAELMKNGLKPNVVIYNALIGGHGRNGNISEAIGILDTMKSDGIQPTTVTYNNLMHWMCYAGLVEEARTIFEQCREKNIELGVIGYTIMIHGFCKIGKIDEAILYFKEMQSRDIPPNKMTYTTLIFAHCKSGNNEEASKLFDEMVNSGIIPDTVSYNTLISGCCEVESLGKAIEMPAEMSSGVLTQAEKARRGVHSRSCGTKNSTVMLSSGLAPVLKRTSPFEEQGKGQKQANLDHVCDRNDAAQIKGKLTTAMRRKNNLPVKSSDSLAFDPFSPHGFIQILLTNMRRDQVQMRSKITLLPEWSNIAPIMIKSNFIGSFSSGTLYFCCSYSKEEFGYTFICADASPGNSPSRAGQADHEAETLTCQEKKMTSKPRAKNRRLLDPLLPKINQEIPQRLPLIFPDKVQRSKALIRCDGDSIYLSGDVGRLVVSNGPTGNPDLLLDLKGTIYKTAIVPSRTFCVPSMDSHLIRMRSVTSFLNHTLLKMIRIMKMNINLSRKPKEKLDKPVGKGQNAKVAGKAPKKVASKSQTTKMTRKGFESLS